MSRIGLTGRSSLLVAASVWAGVVAGSQLVPPALVVAGVVAIGSLWWVRRRALLAMAGMAVVAGALSGLVASASESAVLSATVPGGRLEMVARAATDPVRGRFGWQQVLVPHHLVTGRKLVPWQGPPVALSTSQPLDAPLGSDVSLTGELSDAPGRVRGRPVAGRVRSPMVSGVRPPQGPVWGTVELLRRRILGHLDRDDPGHGLLAGFLIGETSGVGEADLDALRRAGLSHFVAVSGSNVALFLGLWWFVLAPLSRFPRTRAASGILGVALFALVTRAEPSVVRAAALLMVVLVGKVAGWAFDRWTALGFGVAGCLLVAGGLAFDVGFQLSAAATAGVMAGADMVRFGPRWFRTVLGASLAAQLAVAPVVLAVFGTMPLLAPLANLLAAPLVGVATVLGGIGALGGVDVLVALAGMASGGVLEVARVAAPWPQVGALQTLLVLVPAVVAVRIPAIRWPSATVAAVTVILIVSPPGARIDRPAVVFLDVGQGDAALVLGTGFTMAIDAGPDPGVFADRLRHYGVRRLDLLVASHVHADHLEGFRSAVGRLPVGRAWLAFDGQETPSSLWLTGALEAEGIPTATPAVGTRFVGGGVGIEVLGPLRRYASPNDQSIVLEVSAGGRSVLFPGDIEVVAQEEVGSRTVDILKVPHQGAATSDLDWLARTMPEIAVISVGPNDYGHPSPSVIETLESAGATVRRTDRDGDVVILPCETGSGCGSAAEPQN